MQRVSKRCKLIGGILEKGTECNRFTKALKMSSNKRAKKKKAAEQARRNSVAAKEVIAKIEQTVKEETPEVTDTVEAAIPVIVELKDSSSNATGKESVTGTKKLKVFFGKVSDKLKQGSFGVYIAA